MAKTDGIETPPKLTEVPAGDRRIAWEMAVVVMEAAQNCKAKDVIALDLRQVSLVADYFVLASGNSSTQTRAIANRVAEEMKKAGYQLLHQEGHQNAPWILMDFGAVVVHIFREEERRFYDLERLWGDAEVRTL